ncbi:MAG: hypothetical protein Kow00124_32300 [Anaerolineae bacterium]
MQDKRITGVIVGAVALGVALIGTALLLLLTARGMPDAAAIPAPVGTPTPAGAGQVVPPSVPVEASPAQASPTGPISESTPAAETGSADVSTAAAPPAGTLAPGVTPAAPGDAALRYVGDDYDGHDTVLVSEVAPGTSVEGTVAQPFDAHNWEFAGRQGQTVTIRVAGQGETDPRVTLFGPDGRVLGENDDSGGTLNSLLQVTLPADGRYTIRVTVWVVGPYTLVLEVS